MYSKKLIDDAANSGQCRADAQYTHRESRESDDCSDAESNSDVAKDPCDHATDPDVQSAGFSTYPSGKNDISNNKNTKIERFSIDNILKTKYGDPPGGREVANGERADRAAAILSSTHASCQYTSRHGAGMYPFIRSSSNSSDTCLDSSSTRAEKEGKVNPSQTSSGLAEEYNTFHPNCSVYSRLNPFSAFSHFKPALEFAGQAARESLPHNPYDIARLLSSSRMKMGRNRILYPPFPSQYGERIG